MLRTRLGIAPIILSLFIASSVHAKPRQVSFANDPIKQKAVAGKLFDLDLTTLLSQTGTGKLIWSTFNDKPAWLTLNSDQNRLSGTPALSDIGKRTFRISVKDDESGALARIEMSVVTIPEWLVSPINLGTQKEDVFFQTDLSTKVKNQLGGGLFFSSEGPLPAWLELEDNGTLSGTPRRADVGQYSGIIFIVKNDLGETAKVSAFGEVLKVVKPPKFKANPTQLPGANEDFLYTQDISGSTYVSKPEPEPVTFKLLTETASGWLKISSAGVFSGTPGKTDLGMQSVQVELSSTIDNVVYTDTTTVKVDVVHTNHKPQWQSQVISLPDAFTKKAYFQDVFNFASDVDGDSLKFRILTGPTWATLSSTGTLAGTPANSDFGLSSWEVEVSDGSLTAVATLRVQVVNRLPSWTTNPLLFPDAAEDGNYAQSLKTHATDLDNDPLTFTKVSGPAWLKVAADGGLSGTPLAADLGAATWTVRVADGVSGHADAELKITVLHTNHSPYWVQNPLDLPSIKEKVAFNYSIASFAKDPDPTDTLSFKKVSGPAWLSVDAAGTLSGTPKRPDVGPNTFQVEVKDQDGLAAVVTIHIPVEKVNEAPRWTAIPVPLTNGIEDGPYSFDLKPYAVDDDGDALTFSLVSGPSWMKVSALGAISGTPGAADVGDFAAVFEVSDSQLTAQSNGKAKIILKNHPPVVHAGMWHFSVKERSVFEENLNQPKYVEDVNLDALSFSLLDASDFVSLDASGKLTLKPLFKHIGTHSLKARVSDGTLSTDTVLKIEVLRDPRPPQWTAGIAFQTKARVAFSASVADKVKDLDGLPLTFSKKSGPAWLSVDAAGNLSGTPDDDVLGENHFVITAKNDVLGADGDVLVTVLFNNHAPFWTQDPITLPDGVGGTPFQTSVASYAKDPDAGDTLTITKTSGPNWVSVAADGTVSGNPSRLDFGDFKIGVKVTDPSGLNATATLLLKVLKPNEVPRWLQNPLLLSDAHEDQPYSFDLKPFAVDDDGDPLTFKKISGPSWLLVSGMGSVSGTPAKQDVGPYSAVLEVSDGKDSAQVTAQGTVIRKNLPPVIHSENLGFTVKERSTLNVDLKDPQYVESPDGDPLTFSLLDTSDFVTLTSDGKLVAKPVFKHIGDHTYHFRASDGVLTAEGLIKVKVIRDPRAPEWMANIHFETKARVEFSATVADKVKDLDGLPLTFSKKSGPAWLSVDAVGNLSGTPDDGAVGENRFVITAKNDALGADGNVLVTVLFNNHAPYWTQDTIALPDGVGGTPFQTSVASYVRDPDVDDVLTISKVSGPAWITVAANGTVSGNPAKTDFGHFQIVAKVTDPSGLSANTTLTLKVEKPNDPPVWKQDPLALGEVLQDSQFAFDLKPWVTDPEGDALTFKKISGPAWLFVGAGGDLSGVPALADVGDYTAVFSVSDGKHDVEVTGKGRVLKKNHPPVVKPEALAFTVKERSDSTFDLLSGVTDEDGDTLTFTLIDPISFGTLTSAGLLNLKPKFKDIGDHEYSFSVTDGKLSANGKFKVTVIRDPRAPEWMAGIQFTTKARVEFSATVVDKVKDLDGLPLTFSKKSGPAWLSVDAAGNLSGTPDDGAVGESRFVITAKNDALGADGNVLVTVLFNNHAPYWTQDTIALPDGVGGTPFQTSVTSYVRDPDVDDVLTISKISGPAWVSIGADGTVSGNPAKTDFGNFQIGAKVTDPSGLSANTTLTLKVEKPNEPPVWKQDPLALGDVLQDSQFAFDLKPWVTDPEGDALTFKKISGPAWLFVGAGGDLSGVPALADVGDYTAVFSVSDGKHDVDVTGKGRVLKKNHPPVLKPEALAFTVKERSDSTFDLLGAVTDEDGDALSFTLGDPISFGTLSTAGLLNLKPKFKDIGEHEYAFSVTDGKTSVDGKIKVTVVRDPRAPEWMANIHFETKARVAFSATVADKVKDLDGLPLMFSKKSGPAWLSVDAAGNLTGTPEDSDLGDNKFVITAKNDALGADGDVTVTVLFNNHAPYWTQDPIALPIAWTAKPYSQTVAAFATDPDVGDVLKFTKVSGPAWVAVTPAGEIKGTPAVTDVGAVNLQVRVTDPSGLSAVATVTFEVQKPDAPPYWTESPLHLPDATEATAFQFSVAPFAKDPEGQPLTFRKAGGPDWLSLSAQGMLSGTPTHADIGSYQAELVVSDGKQEAMVIALGVVKRKNVAPAWAQSLVFTIKERSVFEENLNQEQYVKDADGDPLSFKFVTLRDFVSLSGDGKLVAKPVFADIGEHNYKVEASDGMATSVVDLKIKVIRDPRPPVWSENPIHFKTFAEKPFQVNIGSKVKDLDGLPLSYSKISGPAWLKVDNALNLFGTPGLAQVGENSFEIEAKNDLLGAKVTVIITVEKENHAPYWTKNPLPLGVTESEKPFQFDLMAFAIDPDGDPLSFKKLSGPAWLMVSGAGQISGTPKTSDIGEYVASFEVSDGKLTATVQAFGKVRGPVNPPVWAENPIHYQTKVNILFSASIANKVKDPQGLPLTFTKESGPAWLSVSAQGVLSGTPGKANLGDNTFSVKASNTEASALVTVIIKVLNGGNQSDVVQVDEAVPGAKLDSVWAIDNSHNRDVNELMQGLSKKIGIYRDELSRAGIHDNGIYLSTHAKEWDGKPIQDASNDTLLQWGDSNWVASYRERMDKTSVRRPQNSPFWTLWRFYQQLPSFDFYQQDYFESKVPMEGMVITLLKDKYKNYSAGTPQSGWNAVQFADSFMALHQKALKPYRFSVMAPHCVTHQSYEEEEEGAENPYKILVQKTSGVYYDYGCDFNIEKALRDYAQKAIFRAYVSAHQRILLSQTPLNSSALKVELGGKILAQDKWRYDANANAVEIAWYLVDMSSLKPGDTLRVSYEY